MFVGRWSCSMWCQINTRAISGLTWGRSDSRQAPSKNFSYCFRWYPSLKLQVFRVGPRGRNRGNHTTKLRHLRLWLSLRLRRHLHHHAKPWLCGSQVRSSSLNCWYSSHILKHEPRQKSTEPLCSTEVSSRLVRLSGQESVEFWSSSSIDCYYCKRIFSILVHSGNLIIVRIHENFQM